MFFCSGFNEKIKKTLVFSGDEQKVYIYKRSYYLIKFLEVFSVTVRLSKLFGMDIYTDTAEYKGKVFDLVINLEKGRIETITTEPLKVKSKQEAKKIIKEKSVPYKNIKSAKDILIVKTGRVLDVEEEEPKPQKSYYSSFVRRR